MVRIVVQYGIEIHIPGVRLNPNYKMLLPATTYKDLAGGTVRIMLEELVPTPLMTIRVVINIGIRRYIEISVWANQRMEIDGHY